MGGGKMTTAKLARALVEQHGFVWDVAYCEAYYYLHGGNLTATPWPIALSHMERVKNVPIITKEEAERIHQTYLNRN